MPSPSPADAHDPIMTPPASDEVFESVAELFGLLSTPVRLKIIGALCNGERNVSQLLAAIPTTQPNMSQHLGVLFRAGVLGRRRDSTQIYYHLRSQRVAALCRAVCVQAAEEMSAASGSITGTEPGLLRRQRH